MEQTPVLIVGAGPTGLMMAAQLVRYGVSFCIVDPKSDPTRESRALVVQARTTEAYQQLGIADQAVAEGQIMTGMNFHVDGRRRRHIPLSDIGQGLSPFPFALIYEQSKNEALLGRHLQQHDVEIDWGWRLETMAETNGAVEATIVDSGGNQRTIRAGYVIGADGASSRVRHLLGSEFSGGTYNQLFFVADLDIDGDIPQAEGSIFFGGVGFALIFPMVGDRHFRLVGIVPRALAGDEPTFNDVKEQALRVFPKGTSFSEPEWFSTYVVHHRSVPEFRVGRSFLIGDAAHVHSPAGGQGMNTGLLDAQNLGWKLAMVLRQQAAPTLLNTYHDERWAFAQVLLSTTDQAFQAATSPSFLARLVREHGLPNLLGIVLRHNGARQFLFSRISQIGIEYRASSLSHGQGKAKALRAGDRFPWIELKSEDNSLFCSFDLFREPGWTAICCATGKKARRAAREACDAIARKLNINLHFHAALPTGGKWRRVLSGSLVLVRPDTFVGYIDHDMTEDAVAGYFKNHVHSNR